MDAEIRNTYEQIAQLPAQVRALCEMHGLRIGRQSDLHDLLERCAGVRESVGSMNTEALLEVCWAQRVLQAILACSDEAELKEPLNRIASSKLDPASSEHSLGQDAVFELEFLQYVRHRGLTTRLGEPDIIVSAPFGDYFIACKSINSLDNFNGQLRSGYRQVEKYGHGCVAFNLERQSTLEQPLRVERASEAKAILDAQLREFYARNTRRFDHTLQEGRLDGVVLQMSCFANVAESSLHMGVFTHTVFYSRRDLQERDAHARFDGFQLAMNGPMGQT